MTVQQGCERDASALSASAGAWGRARGATCSAGTAITTASKPDSSRSSPISRQPSSGALDPLHPGGPAHVVVRRHRLHQRVHARRAHPGVRPRRRPARGEARRLPPLHPRDEGGVAGGDVLRAVVEGQRPGAAVGGGHLHPPRAHPPARPAPLVEQPGRVAAFGQGLGTGEPGHPGADDRDRHGGGLAHQERNSTYKPFGLSLSKPRSSFFPFGSQEGRPFDKLRASGRGGRCLFLHPLDTTGGPAPLSPQ